jgi:hypothetical protein
MVGLICIYDNIHIVAAVEQYSPALWLLTGILCSDDIKLAAGS